ncbi:hypothetical protein C1H46_003762 [Malus baccata]|uniref:Uncharacterized protein n=1 Tax=Malus baccata TaxID=106549 RepID=A0A540NI22_MALBA|nr:hypothetical protein C1H46_003762 [Malus baccata]
MRPQQQHKLLGRHHESLVSVANSFASSFFITLQQLLKLRGVIEHGLGALCVLLTDKRRVVI